METQTTEVENKSTDQPNPNEQSFSDHYESFVNRNIRERFDEMFDENWSEDDNEFIGEDEADSTNQNDCIDGQKCQKVQENGTKLIKRRKNDYSDQQKREIVEEFIKLSDEYKQKGKHSKKEWAQNRIQIVKSIGVGRDTILKWKKEFGLSRSIKLHSKQEKMNKLKEYCEIKRNNPKMRDFAAPSPDDLDQENSKKHFSDQNNSTDQDESVDEQQNESNDCEKIESDQQKREIVQKFREMKEDYKKNKKYSTNEWVQIDRKISNGLGVGRTKMYNWIKKLGLKKETKSKFSELEKVEILKQFDAIKSKCKKAKLKSGSKNELDKKIAKKLGICCGSIYEWKRKFGLSVSNRISYATKIGILKKYAKIKGKNPKMPDTVIADMLKLSRDSLRKWKKQFKEKLRTFEMIWTL